jgi:hypothetical protein
MGGGWIFKEKVLALSTLKRGPKLCTFLQSLFSLTVFGVLFGNSAPHTLTNKDLIKYAATPPNQPQRCILTDYFNNYNFSKLK